MESVTNAAATVYGIVLDEGGVPVIGARIAFLAGPAALPDIAALSDGRGSFTLTAPTPGEYAIHCTADGYAPQTLHVLVRSGQRQEVHFRLNR